MEKICITCTLPAKSFVGNKCRKCVSDYSLQYYHNTKHKRNISDIVRKTKEEKDEHRRIYERNRGKLKVEMAGRVYKPNRKSKDVSKGQKQIEINLRCKKYREANIIKKRESSRLWALRNSKKNIAYQRNLYYTDPEFNIKTKIRKRIGSALKRGYLELIKDEKTINYLGCTFNFFKNYIESKFKDGMCWDDVLTAKIHLDHIRPCASFNLLNKEDQLKCFNYKNIQPLWELDNLIKGHKYDGD